MTKGIIGLDLLGGDHPPADLLKEALSQLSDVNLTLLGTSDVIAQYNALDLSSISAEFIPVEEVIGLTEDPLTAIRQKKNSSLHIGMRLLKEEQISAYIGVGNTGAMLAAAKIHLPPLPSKPRPALLTMLPTKSAPVAVLDVGANLHAKAEHYLEMAHLGLAFQETRGVKKPKIGLLNIGSEEVKGHKELRDAYKRLEKHYPENFVGNVEPRDVFKGVVDILLTEGFTGNVFLKTAEGVSHYLLSKDESVTRELDGDTNPSALLLGLEQLVVKCHSYARGTSIAMAIEATNQLLKHDLIGQSRRAYPQR